MAVATARPAVVRSRPIARRKGVVVGRTRVRRRAKPRVVQFCRVCAVMAVLALAFAYVSAYASLATTSYSRSKLMSMSRQEKIKNERLKVELTRLTSPQGVVEAAQKAGMVYATDYLYLQPSQTVARAPQEAR